MERGRGGAGARAPVKMRYCADTWYLLALFDRDQHALRLFESLSRDKSFLFVSFIAYAETMRKLFQRGLSEKIIESFFTLIQNTGKVCFVAVDENIAREA